MDNLDQELTEVTAAVSAVCTCASQELSQLEKASTLLVPNTP